MSGSCAFGPSYGANASTSNTGGPLRGRLRLRARGQSPKGSPGQESDRLGTFGITFYDGQLSYLAKFAIAFSFSLK